MAETHHPKWATSAVLSEGYRVQLGVATTLGANALEVMDGMGFFGREMAARDPTASTSHNYGTGSFRYVHPSERTGVKAHVRGGHGGKPKRKGAYKGSKAAKKASRKRR